MANEWCGEADITIGGKVRRLSFDHNAIADLEDVLGGRSVIGLMRKGEADSISFIRAAISVGLRKQVRVTPLQAGRWLSQDPGCTNACVASVIKAIGLAVHGPKFAKSAAALDDALDEEEAESSAEGEGDDAEQEDDDADRPPREAGTGSPASDTLPEQD
jgi:hypothetical protein